MPHNCAVSGRLNSINFDHRRPLGVINKAAPSATAPLRKYHRQLVRASVINVITDGSQLLTILRYVSNNVHVIFTSIIPRGFSVWASVSTIPVYASSIQGHSREKKGKKKKGKPGPATSRDMCYVLNSRAAFSTTSCISRRKRRDCPFFWLQLAQSINTRCFFLVSFFSI